MSAPREWSASSTAFAMAAGGAMIALSPTPLMPRSFRVDGKASERVSNEGRSAALGIA